MAALDRKFKQITILMEPEIERMRAMLAIADQNVQREGHREHRGHDRFVAIVFPPMPGGERKDGDAAEQDREGRDGPLRQMCADLIGGMGIDLVCFLNGIARAYVARANGGEAKSRDQKEGKTPSRQAQQSHESGGLFKVGMGK